LNPRWYATMCGTGTPPTGVLPVTLDWHLVRTHYQQRLAIHHELISLFNRALSDRGQIDPFVQLLLGISNRRANYSASDHGLGQQILSENFDAAQRVFLLAGQFGRVTHAREVPSLISAADLQKLKIGVGSEASCLMNPNVCRVANTRTIWTHLVVERRNFREADAALQTFRRGDRDSEMRYSEWVHWHRVLQTSMTQIARDGSRQAVAGGVRSGQIEYLWADAIANELYEDNHR
jgi:hypothetical protein